MDVASVDTNWKQNPGALSPAVVLRGTWPVPVSRFVVRTVANGVKTPPASTEYCKTAAGMGVVEETAKATLSPE